MSDTSKIAKNLERFAQAVASHDRENPTHTAHGIGLAHFDLERLGFDEGEEILPGITIQSDSGVTGNFRVLCDGEHDEELTEAEEQAVEAIATQSLPMISPAGPGRPAPTRAEGPGAQAAMAGGSMPARSAISPTRRSIVGQGIPWRVAARRTRARDCIELGGPSGGDVALHRVAQGLVGGVELLYGPGGVNVGGALGLRRRRSPPPSPRPGPGRSSGVPRISPSSLS